MPLYEYSCSVCGHVFEVIQKFSDKPIKKCEQCSGKVKKIISAPGLSFKGSGWYITDYSSKNKPPDSKEITEQPTKGTEDKKSGDTAKVEKATSDSTKKEAPASATSTSSTSADSSSSTTKPAKTAPASKT